MDTVGKNAKMIEDYIKNQLEEDYTKDQISLKEYKGKKRQPLQVAACSSDAMINLGTPFRGQQVLTPLGSEQTTSSLVVMI